MNYTDFKAIVRGQFRGQRIQFQGSAGEHRAVIEGHYIASGTPYTEDILLFDRDRYLGKLALEYHETIEEDENNESPRYNHLRDQ